MQAILVNSSQIEKLQASQRQAEIVFVMPATDILAAQRAATLMVQRAGHVDAMILVVEDKLGEGFVQLANRCFKATHSRYFGYVAQDAFAGRQWLRKAHNMLQTSGKGLLGFNDGKWAGMLAAFGLGSRDWLERNYPDAELFHPQYQRHYADTEITALAMGNQQYCYEPNAVLVEVDWEKDRKTVHAQDKALFAQRKQTWMPGRVRHPQILEIFN